LVRWYTNILNVRYGNGIGGVSTFLNKHLDLLADPVDKTVFLQTDEDMLYIGVCGSIFSGIFISNISATAL